MSPMIICFIICALIIASFVWGKIPMATTAMLGMALFLVTGCVKPATVLANFGNNNAVMLLSMFVVAAGFNRTQFVKTCANSVNKIAKGNLTMVMIGYIGVTVVLSQFIQSPLVVIGIMAPLLTASCTELGISPSKTMMPLGMASIITCSSLPLGSGATVFAELNGYLQANEYTTYTVGLLDPMKARLPILIIMTIYCIFIAPKFAPDQPPIAITGGVEKRGAADKPLLAPFQEKCGYIIFFATTLGLIFQKQVGQPTWVICLIGAILMVLTGVMSEKEAIQAVPWWMGLLFVGSLTMGSALAETGAGDAIGAALATLVGGISNRYVIGLLFFIIPFLLTQVMQNRTVMMVFIPISILTCKALGANPIGIIILVQQACLAAFMTPMATPAVPQFMAMGGYDIKSVFKQSLLPALIICVVAVGWIMTVFPLY
ncbi:MAG: SLC13 family permease [Angelakisella sp.]|nr:SLC13 family permease [Angelakisella sp.]